MAPAHLLTQALEARLICRQTTRRPGGRDQGYKYITAILYEEALGAYHESDMPLLQSGSQPVTITIPEDVHPSTGPDHYPTIEWEIEVRIKVAQVPDFRLTFPFTVTESR